jgi:hypothetical protein
MPLRHPGIVWVAAFSPDGRTVLTASGDHVRYQGEARLWRADTGEPVGRPLRQQRRVQAAAFSPDGKTVLTGSWDGTARLWDAPTGVEGPELRGHTQSISAVAFGPDGRTALTWVLQPKNPLPGQVGACRFIVDGIKECCDLTQAQCILIDGSTFDPGTLCPEPPP